jgi:general secretion pathway protein H
MWRVGNDPGHASWRMPAVNAHRGSRGFTLFELLLVMLLLGMLYGLAVPMLGAGSTGIDIKTASRQLAAGLRKARTLAVTERRETVLTLDVDGRTFSLTGDPKTYALPKKLDLALFTAQSELVREKAGGIRFFPDGTSTGGRVTVSAGESKLWVDVDWVTGRVAIQ